MTLSMLVCCVLRVPAVNWLGCAPGCRVRLNKTQNRNQQNTQAAYTYKSFTYILAIMLSNLFKSTQRQNTHDLD